MTTPDPHHSHHILDILRRRLQILEQQAAMFSSIYAPPHLVMQIEDTQAEIAQYEAGSTGTGSPATPRHVKRGLPTLAVALLRPAPAMPWTELLAIHLRMRGFRILEASEQTLPSILPQCNTALLYLTPALLKRTALLHSYRQRTHAAPFHLAVVLDGVSKKKAEQTLELVGITLEQCEIYDLQADPAACARALLERVLPMLVQPYPIEQALGLDIFAHANAADFDYPALLRIDLCGLDGEPRRWQWLMDALKDIRAVLNRTRHRSLAIRPMNANLSAAMGLGSVFHEASGFQVKVAYQPRRDDTNSLEWWSINSRPEQPQLLSELPVFELGGTAERALFWSISQDVETAAKDYVREHLAALRTMRCFAPPAGADQRFIVDGAHAAAIAYQWAQIVRREHNRYPREVLHLFYSVPVSLAVMMGTWLNACGTLQCYEYVRRAGIYEPACLIQD